LGSNLGPSLGRAGLWGRGTEGWKVGVWVRGWVSGCVCVVDVDWSFGRREDVIGIGDIPCSSLGAHLYS